MNQTHLVLLFVVITAGAAVVAIYTGYSVLGFLAAGISCVLLIVATVYDRYTSKLEDKIMKTGLIQQYLISNFTVDQSTIHYLKKLFKEDYNLDVTGDQLVSAIQKEQTRREMELEEEEFTDFKNKFFVGKKPESLEEYIKQFVSVFGRGSVRNVYYLKKLLDENDVNYTEEEGFEDKIIALKNLIEKEIERRGGSPRKEDQMTVSVCPRCGNEYPKVLLFCPFCEEETTKQSEPAGEMVYCPRCNRPMVRSILKKEGTFVKGYQCRNLKCLYEMTYEEAHNTERGVG
ncbi:MAG: hypothetical protein WBA22_13285 [Candidatus Methanofastidiosia archaeon]